MAAAGSMVKLSKTMSWVLRHGAEKSGLQYKEGGYLYVDEVLALPQLQQFTEDDVRRVVATNDKQRFHLTEDEATGKPKIRANQGHSVKVEGLDLKPIVSADDCPAVVHGTYQRAWRSIKSEGLSRMDRNHIHFAPGEPGDAEVISGMRKTCQIVVYVDLEAALRDGIQFFQSANNVILSPGNDDGFIPTTYFKEVWKLNPRQRMLWT